MYTCHLLVTLIHNPMIQGSLPVVYKVQKSSSAHIGAGSPHPECTAIVASIISATGTSYADASEQVDRFIQSPHCPSWIRDFMSKDLNEVMDVMQRAKDVCSRPLFTFGGTFTLEQNAL